MANIKASVKDIRRSRKRAEQNRSVRSRLRTLSRGFRDALEAEDKEKQVVTGRELVSAYDHAAKRNIVHPNRVAAVKSRVSKVLG